MILLNSSQAAQSSCMLHNSLLQLKNTHSFGWLDKKDVMFNKKECNRLVMYLENSYEL